MRPSTGTTTALFALLPLLLSAPLPIRRQPLLGGGDGLLGLDLGLGESRGPLDALDGAIPTNQGSLPFGSGDNGSGSADPLGILDPLLSPVTSLLNPSSSDGPDGPLGLPSQLLGKPASTLHNGLLDDLLSPLTSTLNPLTDALGDVLDLALPTKLICADVGAFLLGDKVDVGVCACLGLGLRGDESKEGMWFGRGRDGRGLEGLGVGLGLVAGVNLNGVRDRIRQTGREDLYPAHTLPRCDGAGAYECPIQYQRPDGICGPLDDEDDDFFHPIRGPQLIAHTSSVGPAPSTTETASTPSDAAPTSVQPTPAPTEAAPAPTGSPAEPSAPQPTPTPAPGSAASSDPAPEADASAQEPTPASAAEPETQPAAELVDATSTPAQEDDETISLLSVDDAAASPTPAAVEPTPTKSEVMTVITVPVTMDVVTVTVTSTVTETPAPVIQTQTATQTVHDCSATAAPTILSILAAPTASPSPSNTDTPSAPLPTQAPTSTTSPESATPTADPEDPFEPLQPGKFLPVRPRQCPEGEEFKDTVCCRADMYEVEGQCKCLPGHANNLSLGVCLELDLCLGQLTGGECVMGKLGVDAALPLGLGRIKL